MFEPLKTLWIRLQTPPDISLLVEKLDKQDAAAGELRERIEATGAGRAIASMTEGKGE